MHEWKKSLLQRWHHSLRQISSTFLLRKFSSDVIFCLPSHNSQALSFYPPGVIGQMLRISSRLKGQWLPGDLLAVGFVNN